MRHVSRGIDVHHAAEDLWRRTLAKLPRPLDRMIYLASMRDYNTGSYYHDGLAAQFGQEAASEAIASCHRDAYHDLAEGSLKDLVGQIEGYLASIAAPPEEFLATWRMLKPYRVAFPAESDPLSAELLDSNFTIALGILAARRNAPAAPAASPRRSPDQ